MKDTIDENYPYKPLMRRTIIRLVKQSPGVCGLPSIAFESDFNVSLLRGGVDEEESETDYFYFIEHEEQSDTSPIRFQLTWPKAIVGNVLCERGFIPFDQSGDQIRFEIDVKGMKGRSQTLDVHSHFSEPGLDIRIEHNHELRKTGQFHSIPWPQMQIDAALHYIFAAREALKGLNIPAQLAANELGYVALMGFETNNPYHNDFPPHWHLIYRWPDFAGSQAPHIYMDELGRNTHNIVTIDGIPKVKHHYKMEHWCLMKDRFTHDTFAVKVCKDGGFAITKPGAQVYKLMHYNTEHGVEIYVGLDKLGVIQVDNDTTVGEMNIQWSRCDAGESVSKSFAEIIKYEPLLGDVCQETWNR